MLVPIIIEGLAQACPNYVCKTSNVVLLVQKAEHFRERFDVFTDIIGASLSEPYNCDVCNNNIIFIFEVIHVRRPTNPVPGLAAANIPLTCESIWRQDRLAFVLC